MPLVLGGKKNLSYIFSPLSPQLIQLIPSLYLSLSLRSLSPQSPHNSIFSPQLHLLHLHLHLPTSSPNFISISPLLPQPRPETVPFSLPTPFSSPFQPLLNPEFEIQKTQIWNLISTAAICYCHQLFSFSSPNQSPYLSQALLLLLLSHLQTSKPRNTKTNTGTYRNMSSSSTSTNFSQYKGEERCECGRRVVMRTSLTVKNPGRRFLRCINYKKLALEDWNMPR